MLAGPSSSSKYAQYAEIVGSAIFAAPEASAPVTADDDVDDAAAAKGVADAPAEPLTAARMSLAINPAPEDEEEEEVPPLRFPFCKD